MNIAFRTDASSQIGTSHFMRCLTLADGLKQRGAHIRFISRDLSVHLRNMLAAKDMELTSLDSPSGQPIIDELAHSHWRSEPVRHRMRRPRYRHCLTKPGIG